MEWLVGLRCLVYKKKQITQKALSEKVGTDSVYLNARENHAIATTGTYFRSSRVPNFF